MSFLTKIFGDPNERFIKETAPQIAQINALEAEYKSLSDDALKAKTQEFKSRIEKGIAFDDLLPEAFAAVREAAGRAIGQRHFDVQLMGGMALHRGMIAEMRTGEGKTLTATLPLYLNALAGKGAHLVTVNDYLARLHASWMGQVYHALGLSVGCTQQQLVSYIYDPEAKKQTIPEDGTGGEEKEIARYTVDMDFLRPVTRKEAYAADITYGTNNEFGFDYLRDNMVGDLSEMAQRELYYAIVDEVDSILIDEARTPLIISAPAEESGDLYYKFADLVTTLIEGPDYNVDEKMRTATLTEEGVHKMERALNITNLYAEGGLNLVHHLEQALRAHALFKRDRDYVVKDNEVIIVDEFTGRLMFGRRYSEGLHQAIEAREKVEIQRESRTLATVTFQNYFRLYKKLAGMTGTAVTEAEEFHKIYNLGVVSIPTHRPMIRKDLPDRIYKSANGKWQSIVQEVRVRHESGQPILIGTVSIEKNEHLSHLLSLEGIPHNVLNAKRHEEEARFIAQAGKRGAVTVATNMAGRGVDIILGGNPPMPEEAALIKSLGGLHVIGTERHEARRIDNQLRGRAGRQGDPGSSQFFLSMEDDLMRIFGSDRMKGLMERMGMPEDMPIENRMVSKSIESAQRKVEGHNFDIRKHLVEYDDIINKHREVIYKKRREILNTIQSPDPSAISKILLNMIEEEISAVVLFHTSAQTTNEWNLDEIYETVDSIVPLPLKSRIKIDEIHDVNSEKMGDAPKRTAIVRYLMEYVESHFKELEESVNTALKSPVFINIERGILLRAIDTLWIEHLDAMDHLRTGIGLRGYGQRDPLVEYKRESYRMFTELLTAIRKEVVYSIFKIGAAQQFAQSTLARERPMILSGPAKEMERARAASQAQSAATPHTASFNGKKVGRNDPCPCGAKKDDGTPVKFKHCHGK